MAKAKILSNFSRLSDGDLSTKGNYIVTCLTGNTHFTTPTPTLAVVQAAITAFDTADAAAMGGDKAATALKNQKRDELENVLGKLALYVELNGNDDEAILLTSGFDLKKAAAPVGVLPKPEGFKVLPGDNSGSVKVQVDKTAGADHYLFEYTPTPVTAASVWTPVISSKTKTSITGLTSGQQYAFRVAAIGSDPTHVYSDVISSYVL